MEFLFKSESIFVNVAHINFIILVFAYLTLFPYWGYKIYNRCKFLDYKMKSRPYLTLINFSNLWNEARVFNKNKNDKLINKCLKHYRNYWIYFLFSFIFLVVTSITLG